MMAVNRYRLRHRAKQGERGAKLAVALLAQTDKLLGVILLGNTLVAAGAATLTAVITKRLFGEGEACAGARHRRHLLRAAGLFGNHAQGRRRGARRSLAPLVSYILTPMLRVAYAGRVVREPVRAGSAQAAAPPAVHRDVEAALSQEEIRSLVLEGHYFRGKHRAMLANLFDLESITVDDVMTPRNQIEAIDLAAEAGAAGAATRDQLSHAVAGVRRQHGQHRRHHPPEAGAAPAAGGRARRASIFAHDRAPAVLRARRARRCSPSCSSSRPTGSASGL